MIQIAAEGGEVKYKVTTLVIAGPRDLYPTTEQVLEAIEESGFVPKVVLTGGANGVDQCAYVAVQDGDRYMPASIQPRWDFWRWVGRVRVGGPERNGIMAQWADALLVIKRKSVDTAGTSNMINQMEGKPTYIKEL